MPEALAKYDQVIRADPEFGEAYYGRAMVFYLLGSCDQAINDCNTAIALRKRFVEAYLLREQPTGARPPAWMSWTPNAPASANRR